MAEALYRKYRPQTFDDVVGQEHIERTLKNALEQDKVSHAYLFCGPRGTGKTTTARLLAKALLCVHGPTSSPDGTCQDCLDIADGVHPDVYELDAASRTGVENVRDEIIGRVNYAPTRGRYKVYIIDEVHMLSMAAFNALLKTLEEPPEHVVFILCTTDPQKVPETIHSRCQRFDFHRLSNDEIVARLGAVCVAENVEFEPEALELVAHRAEGGMRNALTSLEQLIAFGGGAVTVSGAEDLLGALDSSDMAEIMNAVGRRDVAACFNWTAQYVESGSDLAQFCRDMAQRVRDLYVLSLAGSDAALDVQEAELREMTAELELFGPDRLARMMAVLGDVLSDLRSATNPRLCFEIALTRMVRPESDLTLASLAERIEALELKAPSVLAATPVQAQSQPVPQAAQQSASQPDQPQPMQSRPAQMSQTQPQNVPAHNAAAPSRSTVSPEPQQAPALSVPPQLQAQQSSSASAAQASAPASGDLQALISNEAALQRTWRSVVNTIKKEKTAYGALLVSVVARPDAYGGIGLEFPAGNSFAYDMAQRPELKGAITKAFREVTGMDVPFTVNRASVPVSAPAPSAPQAANTKPRPRSAGFSASPASARPSAAAPLQGAAPHAASASTSDDEVPLDIYDTVAVPDDASVPPWEEPAPTRPQSQPMPVRSQSQPAPARPKAQSASSDQSRQTVPAATSAAAGNQDEASRLGTMASEIFGAPITFKEV